MSAPGHGTGDRIRLEQARAKINRISREHGSPVVLNDVEIQVVQDTHDGFYFIRCWCRLENGHEFFVDSREASEALREMAEHAERFDTGRLH